MANQGSTTYSIIVEAQGAVGETAKLLNSVANLNKSLQEESRAATAAAKATAALAREQRLAGKTATDFATSVDAGASKFQRLAQLGAAASVQLGDFITQIQSGGNVWIAASQQLGQFGSLLAVIPGAGQVAGIGLMAVAAALPLVGSAFGDASKEAQQFQDQLDAISQATDDFADATVRLKAAQAAGDRDAALLAQIDQQIARQQGLKNAVDATASAQQTLNGLLGTSTSAYSQALQGAQQAATDLNKLLAQRAALQKQADDAGAFGSGQLRSQIQQLDTQINKTRADQDSWNLVLAQSVKALDALGLNGTDAAKRIADLNKALAQEPDLDKRNALMADFLQYIVDSVGGAQNLSPELQAAIAPMQSLVKEADPLADALKAGADNAGLLSDNLQRARDASTALATRAAAALDVIWQMNAASKTAGEDIKHTLDMADAIAGGASEIDAKLKADLNAIEDRRKAMEANLNLPPRLKEAYGRAFDQQAEDIKATADANRTLAQSREAAAAAARNEAQASRDAAKAQQDAARAAEESQRALNSILESHTTPRQDIAAQQAELAKAVAAVGGEAALSDQQLEGYRQAQADLAAQTEALNGELTDMGQIFEDSLQGLFDSLVDGSKTASEAFNDFILDLLNSMTKFLFSQQLADFMAVLASTTGTFAANPSVAAPSVAGMSPANLSSAPTYAAPAVPRVQAGALVMPAAPIAPPSGSSDRAGAFGNVYVQNFTGAKVEARTEDDGHGGKNLRLTLRDEVRNMVSSGALDGQMRTSFGLRRRMT